MPEFVAAWAAWTADHMIMAQRARLSEGKPSDMQEKIDKELSPPTSRAVRVERPAPVFWADAFEGEASGWYCAKCIERTRGLQGQEALDKSSKPCRSPGTFRA